MALGDFVRLNQTIEEFFGRAGAGILTHIGEALFDHLLCDELLSRPLTRTLYEALPQPEQRSYVLHAFANLASQLHPAWHVELDEQPARYVWTMHVCPVCAGRTATMPICHVYVGLLRGAIRLTGFTPRVIETQCIALGAPACQFELLKIARQMLVAPSDPSAVVTPAAPATPIGLPRPPEDQDESLENARILADLWERFLAASK